MIFSILLKVWDSQVSMKNNNGIGWLFISSVSFSKFMWGFCMKFWLSGYFGRSWRAKLGGFCFDKIPYEKNSE